MDKQKALRIAREAVWENRETIVMDYCSHASDCDQVLAHEAFLTLVGWTFGGLMVGDVLNDVTVMPGMEDGL